MTFRPEIIAIRKLHMDFCAVQSIAHRMDDTEFELMVLLATKIGTIMEDVSPAALTLAACSPAERDRRIDTIVAATEQVSALAQAIAVLRD